MKLLIQNALWLESMIKRDCSVYDQKDHHFTITRHRYKKNMLTTGHEGFRMNPQNIKSSGDQCWEKTGFKNYIFSDSV